MGRSRTFPTAATCATPVEHAQVGPIIDTSGLMPAGPVESAMSGPTFASEQEEAMSDLERKKLLVELEAEFRRAGTALAVAQADFEKAYTSMWEYINANTDGPHRVLMFAPDVTMH
jgi:hypothetical protein